MRSKETIAMILAGGQGSRLGTLTKNIAKPAVPFGGKYRIIDFALSNCSNSGLDTVGVLTQYMPLELNSYIGNGKPWDLDRLNGGVTILPPFITGKKGEWFKGTANAIYQNINFIEQYDPEYVLVLSGDHVYKMDYSRLIKFHKQKKADATISVIRVPWSEANRFGIMNIHDDSSIYEFDEKPKNPKSNLASMGVYVFTWKVLKQYLIDDEHDMKSSNDFGKNIIPNMIKNKQNMVAYLFDGYWKDVGTIQSLWESNMDLLETPCQLNLYDNKWKIYYRNSVQPPHYMGSNACVKRSIITEGSVIYGHIEHSVIFSGVHASEDTEIIDSVIMPNVQIKKGAKIKKSIIAENCIIQENAHIGYSNISSDKFLSGYSGGITVIGENVTIGKDVHIGKNTIVDSSIYSQDFNDEFKIAGVIGR